MSTSTNQTDSGLLQTQHKQACSLCARRKVKCDKKCPCSNCIKARMPCTYDAPAAPKPRKRAVDDDLLARLTDYENLMRKHNIDFAPYSHTWIPLKHKETSVKENTLQTPPATLCAPLPISDHSAKQPTKDPKERCLWSTLSSELKYPPIPKIFHKDDPAAWPEEPLGKNAYQDHLKLKELHPQPKQIYYLWQTFVHRVEPLLKIVHAPSLGQRILSASWEPGSAPESLTAMLFCVYNLGIASMTREECKTFFSEEKGTLLQRFRMAAFRALMEANFLTTKDFEVFQALVLFLFAAPESDLTSTLSGAAIRIGQKMGLNRDTQDPKISIFETELRIRVWWQLNGLDARVRLHKNPGTKLSPSRASFGNVRLPLNINDADLHPDMLDYPREHNGPTEMTLVLLKFEVYDWLRSSPVAGKLMEAMGQVHPDETALSLAEEAIKDLENIYESNRLKYLDHSIPLHRMTSALARLTIARLRFKSNHPRRRLTLINGEAKISPHDSELVFNSAVTWLEMMTMAIQTGFARHIIAHLTAMSTVDAYIYMISELRQRTTGQQVDLAWKLVEDLYMNNPQLIEDTENKFFASLGEMTLEAWESRRDSLTQAHGVQAADVTPKSIQRLWETRRGDKAQALEVPGAGTLNILDFPVDVNIDWEYWTDFLR